MRSANVSHAHANVSCAQAKLLHIGETVCLFLHFFFFPFRGSVDSDLVMGINSNYIEIAVFSLRVSFAVTGNL